ncbi:MAG TPA: 50S ribosomal protein L25, partial [Candidatus Paenibacillus intestinavium]|nr:50S ribosomal protein L25 [Candidatus Paenibacillus intestinavium]
IHISRKDFHQWAKGGGAGIVQLQIGDAEKFPVLLENAQRDAITQEYIHIDFLIVNQDEEVRMFLPIIITGTPRGTKLGGIIQTDSTAIEVQALPVNLPASITIDISDFDIGSVLRGGEIKLPEGVSLVSSPDETLVSIIAPRIAEEASEEEAT